MDLSQGRMEGSRLRLFSMEGVFFRIPGLRACSPLFFAIFLGQVLDGNEICLPILS